MTSLPKNGSVFKMGGLHSRKLVETLKCLRRYTALMANFEPLGRWRIFMEIDVYPPVKTNARELPFCVS